MIPKFLKCQKVYSPTPLTTLQRLSFRFERPDGSLLSTVSDTLDIAEVRSSKELSASASMPYGYDAGVENGTSAAYYVIVSNKYFNTYTVSKGDRIIIQNLTWESSPTGSVINQVVELTTHLTASSGFIVVDTGCFVTGALTLGANKQGYCNCLVVRGKFSDPTTGSVGTVELGGTADTSAGSGSVTGGSLTAFLKNTDLTTGRLLNQSHQVQIALRVITRDLDSTSVIRPDNL